MVGLVLEELAVDGCITKAPGGECAGPSPVDRRKQGMKRSLLIEARGIPLGRVLVPANRHDSPLLAPTLDKLDEIGPLPGDITVHLDAGYDSQKTRDELGNRGMTGEIAYKGDKAPIQAGQRWHVERTNAWHNNFNRLQRCYERKKDAIDASIRGLLHPVEGCRVVVHDGVQVLSGRLRHEVEVGVGEGTPGPSGRQVRPRHQGGWVNLQHGADRVGDIEVDPAEAGRLHADTALDQRQQVRQAVGMQAQVVNAHCGQGGQSPGEFGQVAGVDVQLDVHAGHIVDTAGQGVEMLQARGPTAAQVEPDGAHTPLGQVNDLLVRKVVRDLGDPDEARTQLRESVQQVGLVEALERSRDDGAADDTQYGGAIPVLRDGELLGQVAVVLEQRETAVDHVEMGVEERTSVRRRIPLAG
jgi:transposase